MKVLLWLLGGLVLSCAPNAAQAQAGGEEVSAADRIVRSFAECRAISPADLRLQCFDRAAAALEASIKTKEVRVVDRADIRKTRRSLFGFVLPNIKLFGGGDDDPGEKESTEINTTVASARPVANSRVEIRLADGSNAVWQTTDPMTFPPHPGAAIRIRKGTMGTYFIAVEGRTYRAMRLR